MISAILCCSCFNQEKKAKEAFALLFPGHPVPAVVKGRDRLYKYGKELQNDHIIAISKLSGRFAYYIRMDDDGTIKEEYNLITGGRVA